ncbi:uncharacterized protein N0V89_009809 [Didymosphaeria variabile]|uniref:BTB domain-containing protein n=1 Tax=Didymosphaeria variabile TaxID=1932322 RepID=A0A9W9C7Z9_9PLEO|nr:uncharacterized protein N0V89_009809 [Didymosphaeria variabile]KAJ4348435.1 hypothetical protein N0V89_009809 [Didymosphaeria variabile]
MAAQALDFSDDLVQLKVDAVRATFNVNKKVLSASSRFLQAALKREWAASRSEPNIDLSDNKGVIMLVPPYIFGEKIMDIKYKDVVLQKIMGERIPTREIAAVANQIYGGSTPSSPARRLMADMVADLAQKGDEWNFVIERLNK